jgi:hypothetical protein
MKDYITQVHITFSHLVPTININKKMKSLSQYTSTVEAMKKGCKLLVDFIDHIHTMKLIIEEKQTKTTKASLSRLIKIFQNNLHDKKDKFDTTKRGFKAPIDLTKAMGRIFMRGRSEAFVNNIGNFLTT